MGYVLFSPIGNTDPVRGFRDGAWLHICRVYRPRACVIYLSADMCKKEDVIESNGRRKDLYVRTMGLLNQHLYGNQAERYIQLKCVRDPECTSAHSLEYFVPRFQELILQLHNEYPKDELLINMSSGTAGMKGTLMALSALLPFKVTAVQVSDPAKGQGDKPEIVNKDYLVEEAFALDEDNEPGAENRSSLQPLINLVLAMQVNELCRLVQEGDYHTVLQEIQSDVLKAHISVKAQYAIRGAERRSCMKLEEAGKALQSSGFKLGGQLVLHSKERIWQCAEYLLTMKNDLSAGAFDNFIRKLTPLLTNLMELYLASKGKDVRKNGVDSRGKWALENIPDEWRNILDREFYPCFKGGYVAASNLLPLIKQFGDTTAYDLARILRDAEEKVRNMVAHEIVPFGRGEIESELKAAHITGISTPEELADRCQAFLELIQRYDPEYWTSYDTMNAHICDLLKSAQL